MVNEDSPITERINYYLQTEINPGLASHGGQVSLVDVVETTSPCCVSAVVARAAGWST